MWTVFQYLFIRYSQVPLLMYSAQATSETSAYSVVGSVRCVEETVYGRLWKCSPNAVM